jgi:hypothetical protein
MEDTKRQFCPEGSIEEMLVEKIAVAYWRLRRAYRFEVGLIRQELDTVSNDYFERKDWNGNRINKSDDEIGEEIRSEKIILKEWKKDKRDLQRMYDEGQSIHKTYDLEDNWLLLYEKMSYYHQDEDWNIEEDEDETLPPEKVKEFLSNKLGWSDSRIWETLIGICDKEIEGSRGRIMSLERKRENNILRLQVLKKLGNIPSKLELDRLLRYESSIERQFYKALNQLERLQRIRLGDNIPPPLEVEFEVNSVQTE